MSDSSKKMRAYARDTEAFTDREERQRAQKCVNAKKYRDKMLAMDPEGFRAKCRDAQKRYRDNLKATDIVKYYERYYPATSSYQKARKRAQDAGKLREFLTLKSEQQRARKAFKQQVKKAS